MITSIERADNGVLVLYGAKDIRVDARLLEAIEVSERGDEIVMTIGDHQIAQTMLHPVQPIVDALEPYTFGTAIDSVEIYEDARRHLGERHPVVRYGTDAVMVGQDTIFIGTDAFRRLDVELYTTIGAAIPLVDGGKIHACLVMLVAWSIQLDVATIRRRRIEAYERARDSRTTTSQDR